ncbi:MAG: hypothetical protein R2875_03655 [Desulfobacterales bacterium]
MYPRGEKIKDEYDVEVVKHAARVGCEMGADIVKFRIPDLRNPLSRWWKDALPVVIAGGARNGFGPGHSWKW